MIVKKMEVEKGRSEESFQVGVSSEEKSEK
jgi:hypothetical protein